MCRLNPGTEVEPGEGSFHNPAFGKHSKADGSLGSPDKLDHKPEGPFHQLGFATRFVAFLVVLRLTGQ